MTLRSALLANNGLRALWLEERRAVVRAGDRQRAVAEPFGLASVQQWREELSLTDEQQYAGWLERNGWDDEMLDSVLRLPLQPDEAERLGRPSWLAVLEHSFASAGLRERGAALVDGIPVEPDRRVFLTLVEPLMAYAVECFRDALAGLADLPVDAGTAQALFVPSLADSLTACTGRTLILELHVARMRGQLSGDTPEARFQSFTTLLRDPDYVRALLREYPVLAREIADRAEQWLAVSLEFLTRLRNDWPELRAAFADDRDPGRIVRMSGGTGDTHRNGRSVRVVSFASGLRLVYKPHSVQVDVHFQDLIRWLNGHGFAPALRTISLLARADYGWSEFVAYQPCTAPEQIERFYQRQGGLLALLYAIDGTDFHMENLIAAGEHPMLVDLEALFHPRPSMEQASNAARFIYSLMRESVMRVGLLPERAPGKGDFSGLGSVTGEQLSPFRVFQFEGVGTDEMRIVRRQVTLNPGQNRPRMSGSVVNTVEYAQPIVDGFRSAYEIIRRYQGELTEPGGLLDPFAEDEIRVVLRPTRVYGRVLMESSHPTLLRDASSLDGIFYRLGGAVAHKPHLQRVLAEEIADLENGCVPLFTSRPSSRDLWSSRGTRIPEFFEQPSLIDVRERIARLNDTDLARQTWFIRASLATAALGSGRAAHQLVAVGPATRPSEKQRVTRGELLRMATTVGQRLRDVSFSAYDRTSWVGVELRGEDFWALKPVGPDLYAGTAGIALFLGYLGKAVRQPAYLELALSLAAQVKQDVTTDEAQAGFASIGPFSGFAGWIYTLTHLAHLSGNRALLETARTIAGRAVEHVELDKTLDVIGGTAGLLLTLAALQEYDPTAETLRNIVQCADRLIDAAVPAADGVAWVTDMPASAPLTGFSHGASGIGWALFRAAQLTGTRRYCDAAFAGWSYERAVFLHDEGNWPDYREPSDGTSLKAWCHGAPGIGLARLHALRHTSDPLIADDLDRAIRATLRQGFGRSHCLCHGDLGNIELLREAARLLKRKDLAARAATSTAAIVASIRQRGWLCGTVGIEVPGLMIGIAGIGLALLRLARPENVPTPLLLETPLPQRQRAGTTPTRRPRARAIHT